MDKRKLELLKRLENYFGNDDDIEKVSIFTKEELGTPMDVLRFLIEDYGSDLMEVLAECSFLPLKDSEILYFTTVITIREDVPKEGIAALSRAVSKLNFFLPYGDFAINGDDSILVYKASAAIPSDMDDDKIYDLVELSADTSILVAENYSGVLSELADGRITLDDFLETLPQT